MSRVPIAGRGVLELVNVYGRIVQRVEVDNLITQLGDAHVADRMSDAGTDAMSHMAIGTGSGQGSGSQTLATEAARVALTSKTQGTAGDDNDVIYVATFPAGTGTGTITEYAIFNAASTGVMFNYASGFSGIGKTADLALTITHTVTFGSS